MLRRFKNRIRPKVPFCMVIDFGGLCNCYIKGDHHVDGSVVDRAETHYGKTHRERQLITDIVYVRLVKGKLPI